MQEFIFMQDFLTSMKFAHIADCHIGSWRDPKLNIMSTKAFIKAVKLSVEKKVDFILISGDLFNTSLPSIDKLKTVVEILKSLQELEISVYIIPGSHDFSPSGKTMLDVLESAGLLINVVKGKEVNGRLRLKFATDKTGAKITGMLGKRGSLEKGFYEDLDRESLESEKGFKIFMFHSAITEFKSVSQMDSTPLSFLPKGFDYYAAGHVHERIEKIVPLYGKIIFPGPLFPNNFKELEELKMGGFYIYDNGKTSFIPIELHAVESFNIKGKTAEEINAKLMEIPKTELKNKIVTLRVSGKLESGRLTDIDFQEVFAAIYEKRAYYVMKNTAGLLSTEFEEVKIHKDSPEEIEDALIDEHIGQTDCPLQNERELTKQLLNVFSVERDEGEKVADFEERLTKNADKLLDKG